MRECSGDVSWDYEKQITLGHEHCAAYNLIPIRDNIKVQESADDPIYKEQS